MSTHFQALVQDMLEKKYREQNKGQYFNISINSTNKR